MLIWDSKLKVVGSAPHGGPKWDTLPVVLWLTAVSMIWLYWSFSVEIYNYSLICGNFWPKTVDINTKVGKITV